MSSALSSLNHSRVTYHDLPPKEEMSRSEKISAIFLVTMLSAGAIFMWVANGAHLFTFDSWSNFEGLAERFFAVCGTVIAYRISMNLLHAVNKKATPHRMITQDELAGIKTNDSIEKVSNLLGHKIVIVKRELIGRTLSIEKWERNVDFTEHVLEERITEQEIRALCAYLEGYNQAVESLQRLKFLQDGSCNRTTNYTSLNAIVDGDVERKLQKASDAVNAFVKDWPQKRNEIFRQMRKE